MLESPEAIASRLSKTEEFIEKNKKLVFILGGAIAVVIAVFFLYRYYVTTENTKAQNEMFQAVYYFEADSLELALNGDGNNLGLLQIIDDYPLTDAANLAHYYVGVCYLKKGEYISAEEHLKKFEANDLLVQARAYSLIGDSQMESENYKEAVSYYEKAANYKPNEYTTPMYLEKAAIAYEMLKDYKSAYNCYDIIVEKYVNSGEYQNARKQRARMAGLMSS